MKTYRLLPEGFAQVRRQVMIRSGVLGLIAAPLVLLVLYVLAAGGNPAAFVVALGVLLGTAIIALQLYRRLRAQREAWEAYRLDLGPDWVSRTRLRKPDMLIRRDEITGIEEVAGTGLLIKTAHEEKYIFVPAGLDGYAEARGQLAQWRAIEPSPLRRNGRLRPRSFSLLAVVAILAVAVSQNAAVVVVAAALLAAYAGWIWLDTRKDVQADPRLRAGPWLLLALVVLLVLRVIAVLRR